MRKPTEMPKVIAWPALALLALALLAFGGCKSEGTEPQVGSNSNWLTACDVPADCSSDNIPECACGVCTVQCAEHADCAAIPNALCALDTSAAARSSCIAQDVSLGICLPRCEPGSCGPEQACVGETCVLATLPDNAFCSALAASDDDERRRAERLLQLAQGRRTAGSYTCDGSMGASRPELRLSGELMCAARALAVDMEQTRAPGVTDSQGRSTSDRVQLTGYGLSQWAEMFALEATGPEHAIDLMLREAFNCESLGGAAFADVGVAVSGDVYVLTLAAP